MKTETEPKGIIKYSFTKDEIKFYDAMIETIIYDHSPRNPSLPVISSCYGEKNKPTQAYCLTYEDAMNHIKSFGFTGEILVK